MSCREAIWFSLTNVSSESLMAKQLSRINPQSTSRGHVARHHCDEQQTKGGGQQRKRIGGRHADEQATNQAVSDIDARGADQQSRHDEQRAFFQHESEDASMI